MGEPEASITSPTTQVSASGTCTTRSVSVCPGESDELEQRRAPSRYCWRILTRWVGGVITTSSQSCSARSRFRFAMPPVEDLVLVEMRRQQVMAVYRHGRRRAVPKFWLPNVWSKWACVLINACTRRREPG